MSDLATLVGTLTGQQAQTLVIPESYPLEPPSPQEQGTRLVDRVFASQYRQWMAIPHHGRTQLPSSFYDILLRTERERTPLSDFYSAVSNFGYLSGRLNRSRDAVRNAVEMNLNVMHGNPVFQGTRIPLYQIIEELADGTSLPDILEGYPSLTLEKIQTGLDFAASVVRIYDDQLPDR
jgi:uncharacterized protein (DUF433 family)